MFPGSASCFVTCEAPIFLHMVPSFIWGEAYLVNIHCIWVWGKLLSPEGSPCWWRIFGNDVVISSPDFSKSYDVPVKFSSCVKPLFPSLSSPFLAQREGGSSHHFSQLVGDSSLEHGMGKPMRMGNTPVPIPTINPYLPSGYGFHLNFMCADLHPYPCRYGYKTHG